MVWRQWFPAQITTCWGEAFRGGLTSAAPPDTLLPKSLPRDMPPWLPSPHFFFDRRLFRPIVDPDTRPGQFSTRGLGTASQATPFPGPESPLAARRRAGPGEGACRGRKRLPTATWETSVS